MLNMRSGVLQIFVQKIGILYLLGITKKKTIVIIMILTNEVENFLGPPICVQHSEVLWLPFGKTFALDLKFDLNQSAEVGSLRKPGAFNSHPNHMGSV